MALAKLNTGGGFFKPKDHLDADAILFEPERFEAQRPSQYGPQDVIHGSVTIFNGDSVDAQPGSIVTNGAVVRDLKSFIGQQVAAKVVLVPNKKGGDPFPVLRPASPDAEAKVEAYLADRDAALEDAPDFLQ